MKVRMLLAGLAVGALVACGDDDDGLDSGAPAATETAPPTAASEDEASAAVTKDAYIADADARCLANNERNGAEIQRIQAENGFTPPADEPFFLPEELYIRFNADVQVPNTLALLDELEALPRPPGESEELGRLWEEARAAVTAARSGDDRDVGRVIGLLRDYGFRECL